MANIRVFVGTVTGRALEVAEAVAATLSHLGHTCHVNTEFRAEAFNQNPEEVILVCTSNTGVGDLPSNIAPLYEHLRCNFPNIAGRRYGIINLGDSSYSSFAEAGATIDEALADIGAVRVGEPCVLDAIYVDDHVQESVTWAQQWGQNL